MMCRRIDFHTMSKAKMNDMTLRPAASVKVIEKLAELINRQRDAILVRWRTQVRELPSARHLDVPSLNDHMPLLLVELATVLKSKSDQTIPEALSDGSAPAHGLQRASEDFDIQEVVAEYNILRGCIHDLADDNDLILQGAPFHIINGVFDQAIGMALQTYADAKALEVQRRREEYLAFVAHDLRTPLSAISMAGRVLEMKLPEQSVNADTTRMFKALRRNVQHLEKLVTKVLEENANLQTEIGMKLERRSIDLWPLVESLIHDLQPVAGTAGTRLTNDVPEDMVVYTDAGLLRRVFQNLIANAIKYTPNGKIIVGAAENDATGIAECWVSDNGAGIQAERLEKIFDKGETDPDSAGGIGLGLAFVKTFAEADGGMVTVESTVGTGSTFRFSLRSSAK